MSWVNIAKQENMQDKISAAKQLMVFNTIAEYIRYKAPVGELVEVEAGNKLMMILQQKLIEKGVIKEGEWIAIPRQIENNGCATSWEDKTAEQHANAVMKILKENKSLEQDALLDLLLDGKTGEHVNTPIWGQLALGTDFTRRKALIERKYDEPRETIDFLKSLSDDEFYSLKKNKNEEKKYNTELERIFTDFNVIQNKYVEPELSEGAKVAIKEKLSTALNEVDYSTFLENIQKDLEELENKISEEINETVKTQTNRTLEAEQKTPGVLQDPKANLLEKTKETGHFLG